MVREDFERTVRDRACDFTRVRWMRFSGVGSVGGVSEFSIERVSVHPESAILRIRTVRDSSTSPESNDELRRKSEFRDGHELGVPE